MPRENRVHDLRYHGVVLSHDARKYWAAFAQARHQVLAQLIFDTPRPETLLCEGTLAQLAESPGGTHGGEPPKEKPEWIIALKEAVSFQLSAISTKLIQRQPLVDQVPDD